MPGPFTLSFFSVPAITSVSSITSSNKCATRTNTYNAGTVYIYRKVYQHNCKKVEKYFILYSKIKQICCFFLFCLVFFLDYSLKPGLYSSIFAASGKRRDNFAVAFSVAAWAEDVAGFGESKKLASDIEGAPHQITTHFV